VASLFQLALTAAALQLKAEGQPNLSLGDALGFLLDHTIAAWSEQGEAFREYADFTRDGFHCTVPGCTARQNLRSHHIVFRSHPRADEPWNRTTLCAFHHQRGVHARVIRLTGRAPEALVYALGLRGGAPPLLRFRSGDVMLSAPTAPR
jgi:hypothetical protein